MKLKQLFFSLPTSNLLMQMFRYVFSGGVAFVVDMGLTILLHEIFNVNDVIAATFGFCAGLVITYIMSIKWIFDSRKLTSPIVEFIIFAIIGLIGIGLTYYTMSLLKESTNLHYIILKIITTVVVTLFNFIAKKILLFSK